MRTVIVVLILLTFACFMNAILHPASSTHRHGIERQVP